MKNEQNAYVYYFTEETIDKDLLSFHGFDVGFVLGNIEKSKVKNVHSANEKLNIKSIERTYNFLCEFLKS